MLKTIGLLALRRLPKIQSYQRLIFTGFNKTYFCTEKQILIEDFYRKRQQIEKEIISQPTAQLVVQKEIELLNFLERAQSLPINESGQISVMISDQIINIIGQFEILYTFHKSVDAIDTKLLERFIKYLQVVRGFSYYVTPEAEKISKFFSLKCQIFCTISKIIKDRSKVKPAILYSWVYENLEAFGRMEDITSNDYEAVKYHQQLQTRFYFLVSQVYSEMGDKDQYNEFIGLGFNNLNNQIKLYQEKNDPQMKTLLINFFKLLNALGNKYVKNKKLDQTQVESYFKSLFYALDLMNDKDENLETIRAISQKKLNKYLKVNNPNS